jgi:hypothetical protein
MIIKTAKSSNCTYGNCANKHNVHSLLVAKVSSKCLGNFGIVFDWTNLLGKWYLLLASLEMLNLS